MSEIKINKSIYGGEEAKHAFSEPIDRHLYRREGGEWNDLHTY